MKIYKLFFFLLISRLICKGENLNIIHFDVNKYNDIQAIVDDKSINLKDFELQLKEKLIAWNRNKYTAIWLTIPLNQAIYIPIALKYKFEPHHTTKKEFVMTLEFNDKKIIPEYAISTIGAAGLVIDENDNVLVVKERYKPELNYKLPGGAVNMSEDIWKAAIREIKEETGIDTEFKGIIAWRQGHQKNKPSDLYFCCLLKPLSKSITIDEKEILESCWMPYKEFKKIAKNSCSQFLSAYEASTNYFNIYRIGKSNLLTLYANNNINLSLEQLLQDN